MDESFSKKKEMAPAASMSRRQGPSSPSRSPMASQSVLKPIAKPVDPMIAKREAIRVQFLKQREELVKRRSDMAKESAEIEAAQVAAADAIVAPTTKQLSLSGPPVDFTTIPTDLDAALEKLDLEGSLRPAIINVGKTWSKRSQAGLLAKPETKTLSVAEQKLERNACFDLLDGLTKSGSPAYAIEGAALHVVVCSTHCFEHNVMDTLVRDNINPIAKVEHSSLIVASRLFNKPASELIVASSRERIALQSPNLFLPKQ